MPKSTLQLTRLRLHYNLYAYVNITIHMPTSKCTLQLTRLHLLLHYN